MGNGGWAESGGRRGGGQATKKIFLQSSSLKKNLPQ